MSEHIESTCNQDSCIISSIELIISPFPNYVKTFAKFLWHLNTPPGSSLARAGAMHISKCVDKGSWKYGRGDTNTANTLQNWVAAASLAIVQSIWSTSSTRFLLTQPLELETKVRKVFTVTHDREGLTSCYTDITNPYDLCVCDPISILPTVD